MRNFKEKFFDFINKFKKQRWLVLIFGNNGFEIRRVVFCPSSQKLKEKKPIRFLKVDEFSVFSKRIFKIISKLLFFPFSYKVLTILPRKICQSKYFTIQIERKNCSDSIGVEQLASVFSQKLLPLLEANKKEFMKNNNYDDLDVLLVNNQIVDVLVDDKSLSNFDDLFSVVNGKISIGIVQTFLYRGFFGALKKAFPKRATFKEFHEFGFYLPLSVLINFKDNYKKNKKIKRFIVVNVEENESLVFKFDGQVLNYFDSFSFSRRSLYEALHHVIKIDFATFSQLLKKIIADDLSPWVKKKIFLVLNKELARLNNAIAAFKKETKSQAFFINGQNLNSFLKLYRRYNLWVVDNLASNCRFKADVSDLTFSDEIKADILCSLGLNKKDRVNELAIKQIRWLIPHDLDIKQ
jgi:sRNA-binding regulator protein Hfq